MATISDGHPLRLFDAFTQRIQALAKASDTAASSSSIRWHGRRAATLARQAGNCDQLITAALVHDFTSGVALTDRHDALWRKTESLASIFPESVIAPVRLLQHVAALGQGSSSEATSRSLAMAHRLRRLVLQAQIEPRGPVLPLDSLLRIARRVALD